MTERDRVVARALAILDVPEHGPQFWSELEASLASAADELKRTPGEDRTHTVLPHTGETSAVVVDLHHDRDGGTDRPDRRTKRGRLRTWLPAAAVVAAIAAVGVQVVNEPDDSGPNLSAGGGSEVGATTTVPPATTGPTTSITSPSSAAVAAQDAVLAFVDALGRGDIDAAAGMLGPRSEAYVDSLDDPHFLETAASEGYGAWGRSADREAVTVEVAPGSAVVVLSGTVEQEGSTARRVDAFPVQRSESVDTWFVDLWAFSPDTGGRIDPPTPDTGPDGVRTISDGEPLRIAAPGVGTAYVSIDGGHASSHPIEAAGEVVEVTPDDGVRPEGSLVTIAFVSEDGSTFTAIAVPVRVAG